MPSCSGMPRVVCREQRGALSPTCGHTLARMLYSPWTQERGLGRLGNAHAHTKYTHSPTLREDQVHKPGAEGEAPVRSNSKREVSSQLSFSKQSSFWHLSAPHPHVITSNTAFQYTWRGSKSPFPPLIYLSPVSKHPFYR